MDPNTLLFDEFDRIKTDYVKSVIEFLRQCTPEKTQVAVALIIDVVPAILSQMKSARAFLHKKHLALFARSQNISVETFLGMISRHVLTEKPEGSAHPKTQPPDDPDTGIAFTITTPSLRERFLITLQRVMQTPEGMVFKKILNQNPRSTIQTNIDMFLGTGDVPNRWLAPLVNSDAYHEILEQYDPQYSKTSSSPIACTTLSDVPAEFLNAFYYACIAGGKAIEKKLAVEAFIGALMLKLHHCTISSRLHDTPTELIMITITNGKIAIEYHLNISDFS